MLYQKFQIYLSIFSRSKLFVRHCRKIMLLILGFLEYRFYCYNKDYIVYAFVSLA